MKRIVRACVWPVVCSLAVLFIGCAQDNESSAKIEGVAPTNPTSYANQSRGSGSDSAKNYPGAAKRQAKADAAAAKGAEAKGAEAK